MKPGQSQRRSPNLAAKRSRAGTGVLSSLRKKSAPRWTCPDESGSDLPEGRGAAITWKQVQIQERQHWSTQCEFRFWTLLPGPTPIYFDRIGSNRFHRVPLARMGVKLIIKKGLKSHLDK